MITRLVISKSGILQSKKDQVGVSGKEVIRQPVVGVIGCRGGSQAAPTRLDFVYLSALLEPLCLYYHNSMRNKPL